MTTDNEEAERAFRRGYAQGYRAAATDAIIISKAGYSRAREVANIVRHHALTWLVFWQYGDLELTPAEPPKVRYQSWAATKKEVYERQGPVCAKCGAFDNLEVDHIKPVGQGGLPILPNLRVLCRGCNRSRLRPRGLGERT